MKELIEAIVKPLVDFPEDVEVSVAEESDKIIYQLKCHRSDMGKVIGKQGRVAKSIRTVVYAAGASRQKKVFLEIID